MFLKTDLLQDVMTPQMAVWTDALEQISGKNHGDPNYSELWVRIWATHLSAPRPMAPVGMQIGHLTLFRVYVGFPPSSPVQPLQWDASLYHDAVAREYDHASHHASTTRP